MSRASTSACLCQARAGASFSLSNLNRYRLSLMCIHVASLAFYRCCAALGACLPPEIGTLGQLENTAESDALKLFRESNEKLQRQLLKPRGILWISATRYMVQLSRLENPLCGRVHASSLGVPWARLRRAASAILIQG